MGLTYVVGVQSSSGSGRREPAAPAQAMDRARTTAPLLRRDTQNKPRSKQLAVAAANAWRDVAWREGRQNALSRFAAVRVRPAHRDYWRSHRSRRMVLVEWPQGESEPTKYWLSTLPAGAPSRPRGNAKLRWRIERDYQELKQELGLDHYEGRGWRGFHHHMTLCVAAYGFLVSERSSIPPSTQDPLLKAPRLPEGYRPRGSPDPHRAPRPIVHSNRPH